MLTHREPPPPARPDVAPARPDVAPARPDVAPAVMLEFTCGLCPSGDPFSAVLTAKLLGSLALYLLLFFGMAAPK